MPETAPDQPSVIRPPFRADHVGSLLRPPELLQARTDAAAGKITADDLHAVEDDAICTAVTRQQEVGLATATDGDAQRQHERYIAVINQALAGRPADLTVTTHMCRGNNQSMWAAEGGYEFVADALFSNLDVDGFFCEWDDELALVVETALEVWGSL
jgi:methionine synthase II (cobalamin-independent)